MESEAPAHLNQVITPMNNFYPPQEKVAFTKYFLDFSSPITFWREGRGDIFCLKESDEKACVFIIRHFNSWNSPEDAAVDILDKYSQQVKDFEIYDRHETFRQMDTMLIGRCSFFDRRKITKPVICSFRLITKSFRLCPMRREE